MADVAAYVVGCGVCCMFTDRPEEESGFACRRCGLVALLEEGVRGLEERMATLRLIEESGDFLDRAEASLLVAEGGRSVGEPPGADGWGHVARGGGKTMERSPATQLENRYQVFVEDEDGTPGNEAMPAGKEEEGTRQQVTARGAAGRRRGVVVVGDSLLGGTEAAVCRPDMAAGGVCCLPGAMVGDVAGGVPELFGSEDVHPFLLVHVGTGDAARRDLPTICGDFEGLGRRVGELDARVVFSSVLPVDGRGAGRWSGVLDAGSWLGRWCRRRGFGFLDRGVSCWCGGLLAGDGLHLGRPGGHTFAGGLAALIGRALDWGRRGREEKHWTRARTTQEGML